MSHVDYAVGIEEHARGLHNVFAVILLAMLYFMDARNIVAIYGSDDENIRSLVILKRIEFACVRGKLSTVRVERQRSDNIELAAIAVKALAPDICILLEVETENESSWT